MVRIDNVGSGGGGESFFASGSASQLTVNNARRFFAEGTRNGAEEQASYIWPVDATFEDLYVIFSGSPGAGDSFTCDINIGGVPSGIQVVVSDAGVSGSDLINNASVTAGQIVSFSVTATVTATNRRVRFGWKVS